MNEKQTAAGETAGADNSSPHAPAFQDIAKRLASDIRAGVYKPGDRLPPHRELAHTLGVAVATVTRAYAELSRIGLTKGETGRGTFVRRGPRRPPVETIPDARTRAAIDLSMNQPATAAEHERALRDALEWLAERGGHALLRSLASYQPSAGRASHRQAVSRWLEGLGMTVGANEVIVTAGIQHALATSIAAAFRPGDVVLCEALTNPSFQALTNLLRLNVVGVPMDQEGLIPDALDGIAGKTGAAGLYTIPSLQNPTGAVMSASRRAEIADIATRHRLVVVENAAYDALLEAPPPPLTMALRRSASPAFYVSALTKIVATGLRFGFVAPPPGLQPQVAGAIFATTTMAPPLDAEIAAHWINNGTAAQLAVWQRTEAQARRAIAQEGLGELVGEATPACNHLWLRVPEPWRADQVLALCRARGVLLGPPEAFVVGRGQAPQAIRMSLGAARDRETLQTAVATLADVLSGAPILSTSFN